MIILDSPQNYLAVLLAGIVIAINNFLIGQDAQLQCFLDIMLSDNEEILAGLGPRNEK